MATQNRRKETALIESLEQAPWRFEFFQAVRLLELLDRQRKPVGRDFPTQQESVRFRALLSRSFPSAPIARVELDPGEGETGAAPEMLVAFMGLTGPAGVMPEGYLDLQLQRLREHDYTLRDFFDLFNHRTISLFYRAWEKYQFPIGFERTHRGSEESDLFSGCLECLVGMGTGEQKSRLHFDDRALLRYAGFFSHFPRSATVLEALLVDYLKIPAKIEQLAGRWLPLETEEQSQLPSRTCPEGHFNQLGHDLVIGTRVWDVQSSFRIRLGPLTRLQFNDLLPTGSQLRQVCSLTRMYAGVEFDFEIQLILRAEEVPMCQLGNRAGGMCYLGWNTWLRNETVVGDRDNLRFLASYM